MPRSHGTGYCPNAARKTTASKGKGPKPNRLGPSSIAAAFSLLEPASRLVSFFSQAHEDRDDSRVLVVWGIDEEPGVEAAVYRGDPAPATALRRRPTNRH